VFPFGRFLQKGTRNMPPGPPKDSSFYINPQNDFLAAGYGGHIVTVIWWSDGSKEYDPVTRDFTHEFKPYRRVRRFKK